MSNIGWDRLRRGDTMPQEVKPTRKVAHTAKQRLKEDMSESQKEGVSRWNLMIDVLQENGLMEEK